MKILFKNMDHSGELHCDNPLCEHQLPPGAVEWGEHLINYSCPKCGSNMLTLADYLGHVRLQKRLAWINKWLGPIFGTDENDPSWDNAAEVGYRYHDGKVETRKK